MSLTATKWAWLQRLKSSQKIILLSLADRADKKNNCYPSVTRLSEDTCLDRKTVISGLKYLEANRLIQVKKEAGISNYYTLNLSTTSTKNGTSPKIGTSTKNGTLPVPKTVPDQYQKRDTNLSRTYQEPKEKKKEKKAEVFILPEWVNEKAWLEYLQHRKEINKPFSDFAKTKAAKKLSGFDNEEQQAAIDDTIQNRWTGVFPKKLNGHDNEENKRNSGNGQNRPQSNHARYSAELQERIKNHTTTTGSS